MSAAGRRLDDRFVQNGAEEMIKRRFHDKIGKPILNLLKQGISPEKLSLSIAFGAVIGILPILGATTLICAAIAILLRLNLPAIQLFNYLVYPLQIFLLIPFMSLGAFIFQVDLPPLSFQELSTLFQQNFWGTMASFFETILYAVVAWLLVCVPLFVGIYAIFVAVLKRFGPMAKNGVPQRSYLSNGVQKRLVELHDSSETPHLTLYMVQYLWIQTMD